MTIQRMPMFKRFERFWHWSQAVLIVTLMLTGFRLHGLYGGVQFGTALQIHLYAAWSLVVLWVFAIFWHFTTGEWRHYIPTLEKIVPVIRHYAFGIFRGEPHPYHPTPQRKHNPLQRLAYLWVKLMINPLIWISGAVLLGIAYGWIGFGPQQSMASTIRLAAWAHTAGAYMMLVFFILHVYLTTTGSTPLAHIKAMVTGWEEVHEP